jgi:predicted aspartyl protease
MLGFAAAAFTWLGGGPALAGQSCELKLDASLPIARMGDPPTIIVAARHGDTPLRLIFDTGASDTLLEGQVVSVVDLRRLSRDAASGAGGDIPVWHSRNVSLVLGGLTLNLPYVTVTDPHNRLYGGQFDGLLGVDALLAYDFEFDPEASRIRVFSQEHCRGQVVYWANEYSEIPFTRGRDHKIDVAARIDGKPLRGIIDTGASHTSMNWAVAQDSFGLTPTSAGVSVAARQTLTSDGKLIEASRYTFDTLELGPLRVHSASVNILPQSASATLGHPFGIDEDPPEVVIGMDLLQHFRFYVANAENMIYFTLARPPA